MLKWDFTSGGNPRSSSAVSIPEQSFCVLSESAGNCSTSWFLNSSGDVRALIALHPAGKDRSESCWTAFPSYSYRSGLLWCPHWIV